MSQENAQVVHAGMEAFNRRDVAGLVKLSDRDLELVSVLTAIDVEKRDLSRPWNLGQLLRPLDDTWDKLAGRDVNIRDTKGGGVAVLCSLVGRGKASKVPVATWALPAGSGRANFG